jgi:ERCC4-related helicase
VNPSPNDIKPLAIQLLPHQAAFVETFFEPASKRVIVLRADVGLGKSTALIALCSRLLQERTKARVLIVVPAQLRAQFAHKLRDTGVPSFDVDRYRYREMLDCRVSGELWPAGNVIVIAREFARQHDIRNSLASTRWDVLIVDEAHQFRAGMARDLIRHVGESSERIVLSEVLGVDSPDSSSDENATLVVWRREQVVGLDGKPLDVTPRPALRELRYDVSSAELILAQTVAELCQVLQSGTSQQSFIARSWLRSFQSSPAALESKLPKLASVRGQATQQDEVLLDDLEDEASVENLLGHWLNPEVAQKAATVADRLAEGIEGLGSDSKLNALVELMNQMTKPGQSLRRICVVTDYIPTLFYIAEGLETQGLYIFVAPEVQGGRFWLLHGSMNYEDRQSSIAAFRGNGGVLIATSAAVSEANAMPDVTDLVLYDVPSGGQAMQQVLGRFDRFGRRTQLNVYALFPSPDTLGTASESIQLLRQFLGATHAEEGG